MPSYRATRVLQNRASKGLDPSATTDVCDLPSRNSCLRVLVLDANPRTWDQVENALWMWPHKIATASSIDEAVRMCKHLEPAAIIASLEFPCDDNGDVISTLRTQLPHVGIIALGTAADVSKPGFAVDLGADAVISREELHQPTLYDLIARLRPAPCNNDANDPGDFTLPFDMPLPWRESRFIGSLICDVEGAITHVNECLVRWLDYPASGGLLNKYVWRDVLASHDDWMPWKTIAGDTAAMLHQSVTVRARNQQLLWMDVQVFALPISPTYLQAAFVDKTELALLTGSFRGRPGTTGKDRR